MHCWEDYGLITDYKRKMDQKLMTGDAVYRRRDRTSLGVSTGSLDGYAGEPFQPYDALKYAKMETRASAAATGTDLKAGDRVQHKKFGEGMVIEADGSAVTVIFDTEGVKKLALGFAPLKKV